MTYCAECLGECVCGQPQPDTSPTPDWDAVLPAARRAEHEERAEKSRRRIANRPVQVNGQVYRSLLEGKCWAACWLWGLYLYYEPKREFVGYSVSPDGRYLPDFVTADGTALVEVKPGLDLISREDMQRLAKLAQAMNAQGRALFVMASTGEGSVYSHARFSQMRVRDGMVSMEHGAIVWCPNPRCGKVVLVLASPTETTSLPCCRVLLPERFWWDDEGTRWVHRTTLPWVNTGDVYTDDTFGSWWLRRGPGAGPS